MLLSCCNKNLKKRFLFKVLMSFKQACGDCNYKFRYNFVVFFVLVLLFSPVFVSSTTVYINGCRELNESGTIYVLQKDIIDSSANVCFDVTADNVILDCDGHLVDGVGSDDTYGVRVYRSSDTNTHFTLRNCRISDWDYGVYLENANNNSFFNVSSFNNSFDGFYLFPSSFNSFFNVSSFNNSFDGFHLSPSFNSPSSFNSFFNVFSFNNHYGFYLSSSYNNSFFNVSSFNNHYGFYLFDSSSFNSFFNVFSFNNHYGFYLSSSDSNSFFNVSSFNNGDCGFSLSDSSACFFVNVFSFNNGYGFFLMGPSYDEISSSFVFNNSHAGVWLYYAGEDGPNLFFNNFFNNSVNVEFDGKVYMNFWNTSRGSGVNIVGERAFGGNVWAKPNGSGFSQICEDLNHDGFCDKPYELDDGNSSVVNVDYLPLALPSGWSFSMVPSFPHSRIKRLMGEVKRESSVFEDDSSDSVLHDEDDGDERVVVGRGGSLRSVSSYGGGASVVGASVVFVFFIVAFLFLVFKFGVNRIGVDNKLDKDVSSVGGNKSLGGVSNEVPEVVEVKNLIAQGKYYLSCGRIQEAKDIYLRIYKIYESANPSTKNVLKPVILDYYRLLSLKSNNN